MITVKHNTWLWLIGICLSLASCSTPTSAEFDQLNGPIKSVTHKIYEAEVEGDDWIQSNDNIQQHYITRYGEDGMISKTKGYDPDGEIGYTCTYEYEDGLLIEQEYSYGDDSEGSILEFEYEDINHFSYKTIDSEGELVGEGESVRDGIQMVSTEGKYYYGDDTITVENAFEYEDGLIHMVTQKNSEINTETSTYIFYRDFDEHNNWTRSLNQNIHESDTSYTMTLRTLKYRD